MSTHVPGFQSFIRFLHDFVLAKLATSSITVNVYSKVPFIKTTLFEGTPSSAGLEIEDG